LKTNILYFSLLILPNFLIKAQSKFYPKKSDYLKAGRSIGIDFQGISTSFHTAKEQNYKGIISFGGEVGILPDFASLTLVAGKHFTQKHTIWSKDRSQENVNGNIVQLIFLHAFTRWQPKEVFEMDMGIRFAQFIDGGPIMEDSFGFPRFVGFYAKPLIGFEELKFGGRFDFGYLSAADARGASEFVVIVSPLIRFKF